MLWSVHVEHNTSILDKFDFDEHMVRVGLMKLGPATVKYLREAPGLFR